MEEEIVLRAIEFATRAHEGQVRKYTGEPYITHPIAVARIVATVPGHTTEMLAAAVLHDTVEDTPVTIPDIHSEFGAEIASLVHWLTEASTKADGNRATRKAIDRAFLAQAPAEAQTIKLADLIHNTASISQHDPNFWKVYRREKELLLEVLTKGDSRLYAKAQRQVLVSVSDD